MLYQKNFTKLQRILGDLTSPPAAMKLISKGFMDLCVEAVDREANRYTVALAHYYEQNGDLISDPDMTVRVMPEVGMVEALSYQDGFGYREVYPKPGFVDVKAKKELNAFLGTWLSNLLAQGFRAPTAESLSPRRGV